MVSGSWLMAHGGRGPEPGCAPSISTILICSAAPRLAGQGPDLSSHLKKHAFTSKDHHFSENVHILLLQTFSDSLCFGVVLFALAQYLVHFGLRP